MLKQIKFAVFLLFLAIVFMTFGVMHNTQFTQTMARGNYFFEKTRNNAYITSIILKFPDNKTITFVLKDGLWRIKEADDYYADFSKINTLIKVIRNTTIYRADKVNEADIPNTMKDALSVTSIDEQGKIVDTALIAPKRDINKFYYATLNHQPVLYQLSGKIELSPLLMDWVKAPLLAIPYNHYKRIESDNFEVYRNISVGDMLDVNTNEPVIKVKNLADHLWFLNADEIKHALHFNRDDFKHKKSFTLTTFAGGIYNLTLYYNQNDYWMTIALDREQIVPPSIIKSIKENTILYDGWYFKINSGTGAAIANFFL